MERGEYSYLFDGQGNGVGLEDPGQMVGSYDFCPTGNEADLPGGTVLTQQALNNPLRQGGRVYDGDLKDYFGPNGVISEDYGGVGTQTAGLRFGSVMFLSEEVDCSSPDASEDCSVTTGESGSSSASAGGGGGVSGPEGGASGNDYDQYPPGNTVPMNPRNVGNMSRSNVVQNSQFRAAANRAYRAAQREGCRCKSSGTMICSRSIRTLPS